ncbi:uncharacterized protein [Phaseolus vulgaris]|uniref:uncharacterized protein n=1 Tax=Phaseolus vulgaris TaxID=3885 RepID=UPI0035CC50EB
MEGHLPQILPPKFIPFFDQFPVGYHPYILDVVDVKVDGHCGYRAIAAELGMGEESWAGTYKWMTIPDMGYVIANQYDVILVKLKAGYPIPPTDILWASHCYPTAQSWSTYYTSRMQGLVANEVLEEYKRKRKSCVFFKVDYEKAYDSVSWDFLYYMLERLGFCVQWICWIKGCLESASVSVLVNGSPTREFIPRKGLRQGDPLAPFLFLIVAEGLTGVSRMAEEKSLIDSLVVGKANVKVNMLQYVDDTLFFCEANTKSVFNIKAILLCFELASGLKVNFLKSRIGGLGLSQSLLQHFAAILNCKVMVTPFVYLGLPVGGSHKRGPFWSEVLERVQGKLSRWRGRCLSLAGRICLIKSVLSSIPLFFMSLFKLPSVVAEKLVRLQRNFLWGWGSDGRKIAWVSWKKVCEPRDYGGLGVIDLRKFNLALLGKWIWRLGTDKGGLWKEILVSKYGGWRNLREVGKIRKGSLWWKDLMEVWASEGWGRSFEDGFQWDVGDGKGISFWEDSWLSCGALKVVFPRLFSLSLAKDAKVAELGNWIDGVWVWHFVWRRSFFEWEKPLEEQLVQLLQGAKLELGKEDCWFWKAGGFKTFTVNSAYVQVRKDTVGEVPPVYSKLWRCKALPSALFTAWRVIENKVATRFRLSQASDSVNDVWGAIWVGVVSEHILACAIVSNFQASNNEIHSNGRSSLCLSYGQNRIEAGVNASNCDQQQLKYLFLHRTSYIKVGLQNTVVAYVSSL